MLRILLLPVIFTLFCTLPQESRANEQPDDKEIEVLPPPKRVPTPATLPQPGLVPVPHESFVLPVIPPHRPRPGTREVWQYYAVDGRGQFRPRVILSPAGAYDYRTLEPYPFITTQPNRYLPYVLDGGIMVPGR